MYREYSEFVWTGDGHSDGWSRIRINSANIQPDQATSRNSLIPMWNIRNSMIFFQVIFHSTPMTHEFREEAGITCKLNLTRNYQIWIVLKVSFRIICSALELVPEPVCRAIFNILSIMVNQL